MACLHARGVLGLGEEIVVEGVAGGLFRGRLTERTEVGGFDAVIPEVSGPAHITGFHQFVVDSDDPLGDGFEMD